MGICSNKEKEKDIYYEDPDMFKKSTHYPRTIHTNPNSYGKYNIVWVIEQKIKQYGGNISNFLKWKEQYLSDENYRKEIEGRYLVLMNNDFYKIIEDRKEFKFEDKVPSSIFQIFENIDSSYTYESNCHERCFRIREPIYDFTTGKLIW